MAVVVMNKNEPGSSNRIYFSDMVRSFCARGRKKRMPVELIGIVEKLIQNIFPRRSLLDKKPPMGGPRVLPTAQTQLT